ncbi:MAG: shikimate dehydrogenase family protein, partial [Anaerolineae bacterium]
TGTLTDLAVVVQSLSSPLVVNTTPIGMTPQVDTSPWPDNLHFPAGSFVYDLVYNPRQTSLIQQARAAGCQAENGLGMLVQQGAAAFQMWTGMMPDIAVMHAVGRADA